MTNRNAVWFVDHTATLHVSAKGTSANACVKQASRIVHFVAYRWNIRIWFEFTDSGGNWSDGVSRDLHDDVWAKRHKFEITDLNLSADWWRRGLTELWESMGIGVGDGGE